MIIIKPATVRTLCTLYVLSSVVRCSSANVALPWSAGTTRRRRVFVRDLCWLLTIRFRRFSPFFFLSYFTHISRRHISPVKRVRFKSLSIFFLYVYTLIIPGHRPFASSSFSFFLYIFFTRIIIIPFVYIRTHTSYHRRLQLRRTATVLCSETSRDRSRTRLCEFLIWVVSKSGGAIRVVVEFSVKNRSEERCFFIFVCLSACLPGGTHACIIHTYTYNIIYTFE